MGKETTRAIIPIVIDKFGDGNGSFVVRQGNKISDCLSNSQLLGLISALTDNKDEDPCLNWMKEGCEEESKVRISKPSEDPDRPENPDKKNEAWSDPDFKKVVEATTAFVETDTKNRCAITIFGDKKIFTGQVFGSGGNLLRVLTEFLSDQGEEDEIRTVKKLAMILATNDTPKL